jgi:hypothetical protein
VALCSCEEISKWTDGEFDCPDFSIFGELKNQPSRLSPNEEMNAVMGHKVAIGLQIASTLLVGEILETTEG